MGTASLVIRDLRWAQIKHAAKRKERDHTLWVFGEWFGERCCDNCLFFANFMAHRRPDYSFYWIAHKGLDTSALDQSVEVLEIDSAESREVLARAGVAVYNQGLLDFSTDRGFYTAGAINVNLWHGVPWKHLGLDIDPNASFLRRAYRTHMMKVRKPDYFVALSPGFESVLQSAYLANEDEIIRSGYPRNECFYRSEAIREARQSVFDSLELDHQSDVAVIAYMPTFRDDESGGFSFSSMHRRQELDALLEANNAIVIEKGHFIDERRDESFGASGRRVYRAHGITGQELLCAADYLVTDYSSCFFDYLLRDRPIIHYMYDYDHYLKCRGLYYKPEDAICGDAAYNEADLLCCLANNMRDPARNAALRLKRRSQYLPYESADSCEIIYQMIQSEIDKRDS